VNAPSRVNGQGKELRRKISKLMSGIVSGGGNRCSSWAEAAMRVDDGVRQYSIDKEWTAAVESLSVSHPLRLCLPARNYVP
jgi:hypothetical protein